MHCCVIIEYGISRVRIVKKDKISILIYSCRSNPSLAAAMLRAVVVGAGSISLEFALRHLVEELGVSVVAVVDTQLYLAESLARDVSLRRSGVVVVGDKYRKTVTKSTEDSSTTTPTIYL